MGRRRGGDGRRGQGDRGGGASAQWRCLNRVGDPRTASLWHFFNSVFVGGALSTMSNRPMQRPKVSHSIFPARSLVTEGMSTFLLLLQSGWGHLALCLPHNLATSTGLSLPRFPRGWKGRKVGGGRVFVPPRATGFPCHPLTQTAGSALHTRIIRR